MKDYVARLGDDSLVFATGLPARATGRHLNEGGLVLMTRMVRHLVSDPGWRPLAIGFAHPCPSSVAEHVQAFGVEPTFGGSINELRFDAAILPREVRHADRTLLPIVEHRLQEVLTSGPDEDPWLAALRVQIAGRLCDGHPTLADVAPDVGLTTRTLQRRLAAKGVVYRDLVQESRHRLAHEYLQQSDTGLTEIAFLLGYSDLSATAHAFRRWTGRSPGAARRSRSGGSRCRETARSCRGPVSVGTVDGVALDACARVLPPRVVAADLASP